MSTEPTSQSWEPDGDDDGFYELYDDAHAAWLDTWAPKCPIRNLQRPAELVGYREREPGRLQLRAIIGPREGVCEAIVEEDDEAVRVRVLLCYEEPDRETVDNPFIECPVHVYLDNPTKDTFAVLKAELRTARRLGATACGSTSSWGR